MTTAESSTNRRIFYWSGFCLLVLPFAWLALYNHPAADDFPLSQTARDWGQYTTVVGYWKCWSARYTSIFLMSVNPLVFNSLWGYKAGFFINLFVMGFAVHLGNKLIFNWLSKREPWLFSTAFTLVLLAASPSLSNGYYYLAGAWFYQPGHLLLTALIWTSIHFQLPDNIQEFWSKSLVNLAIVAALVVLLIGCNEVMMLLGLSITGFGLVWYLLFEKRFHPSWFILVCVAVGASALVILSPASFYRMEASGSMNRSTIWVAIKAAEAFSHTAFQSFLSPPVLAMLMAGYFLPAHSRLQKITFQQKLLMSIASWIVIYLAYFPSMLGEGLVQGRTEVTFQFLFVGNMLLNISLWKPKEVKQVNFNLMLIVILLLVPFGKNYLPAIDDLSSGRAKTFNQERNDRIKCLIETAGDSVWVKPVSAKPASLFVGDIGDYPQPWYDNHVAIYYGKKFIHLVGEQHPKPSCE